MIEVGWKGLVAAAAGVAAFTGAAIGTSNVWDRYDLPVVVGFRAYVSSAVDGKLAVAEGKIDQRLDKLEANQDDAKRRSVRQSIQLNTLRREQIHNKLLDLEEAIRSSPTTDATARRLMDERVQQLKEQETRADQERDELRAILRGSETDQ